MEESVMKNERRQFRRFRHEDAVRIQLKDPKDYCGSLSHDISRKGLKVDVPHFIALGAEVLLTVSLDQLHLVECHGQVVWVKKQRCSDRYLIGIELQEQCDPLDLS